MWEEEINSLYPFFVFKILKLVYIDKFVKIEYDKLVYDPSLLIIILIQI